MYIRRDKSGFTLIELLIVVAIIGILAAIAVPNFLNAQVRAKISRAVSDMKNIDTSLEMYKMDNNTYPPWRKNRALETSDAIHPNQIRFYRLTTPVAYMSSIARDPFVTFSDYAGYEQWGTAYDYVDNNDPDDNGHSNAYWYAWRMNSWGPDGVNHCAGTCNGGPGCPGGKALFVYQSSNGLTSLGDIVRVGPKGGRFTNVECHISNSIN